MSQTTCPHCGAPLRDGALVCGSCDAPVTGAPPVRASEHGLSPPPPLPPVATRSSLPISRYAIISLVCGILWLCTVGSVLALIFGYLALNEIERSDPEQPVQGKGLAIAGLALGWLGVGLLVAAMVGTIAMEG